MPEVTNTSQLMIYQNSWQHLRAELQWLDLLLEYQVLLRQATYRNFPDGPLRGLTISADEVVRLLAVTQEARQDEANELQELARQIDQHERMIRHRVQLTRVQGGYLSLSRLVDIFKLNAFEAKVLIICLAPELDLKYEKIYGFLQDDLSRKKPGVELVLNLLCKSEEDKWLARLVFEPAAPLNRYLIALFQYPSDQPASLLQRGLKLDHRIVNFLLDFDQVDHRIRERVELKPWREQTSPDEPELTLIDEVERFWGKLQNQTPLESPGIAFYFFGPPGSGKKYRVQRICQRLRIAVLQVDLQKMLQEGHVGSELLRVIVREAVLQQAALCFEHFDLVRDEPGGYRLDFAELERVILQFGLPLFLLGHSNGSFLEQSGLAVIRVAIPLPDELGREQLWQQLAAGYPVTPECDWEEFAGKFRFTPGQMHRSLTMARLHALWRAAEPVQIEPPDLYRACHENASPQLNLLARKITPRYTWEQLILPDDQNGLLENICTQAKYRFLVYGKWGFDRQLSYGKGLNVLFFGVPGTGKTMAAEVMARELQLEIFKVDLSRVVSKYIGETEKNLSRIFDEAEVSNAILFFDEADALFGKRSEVKDAHDRYANVEIGYLLQRMEEYSGVVILATNLSKNLDEAFLRRMQFAVEFPFPDSVQRERIWRTVFPPEAPLEPQLDYGFLAEKLKISGGNIKNIAINAAFNAAKAGGNIGMVQIMIAAKREYQKIGKAFLKADFQPYYSMLNEDG